MDNQKSFREKKLIEILIVTIIIVFLVGSIVFAFSKRTKAPVQKHVTSSVPQSILDKLSAATTTTKIPKDILDKLSAAAKNNASSTIPQSILNKLKAAANK